MSVALFSHKQCIGNSETGCTCILYHNHILILNVISYMTCSHLVCHLLRILSEKRNTQQIPLLCPPLPQGKGGHLDLLWFPITQMCGIYIHPHPCLRLSVPDFVYVIFTWFFTNDSNFQIWWPWTRPWIDSLFVIMAQFPRSQWSLCFKINFVYAYFLYFCADGFQISTW